MNFILSRRSTNIALGCCLTLMGGFLLFSQPVQAGLFSPKGDSPEEKRQVVQKQRDQMLEELYKTKPELKDRIPKASGYATFKQTDLNLFLLASGRGYGVVHDNKSGKDTYMCVGSLGTGLGMGVKDLRVVFLFNDAKVMQEFMDSGWQFGGKADASGKYKDTGVSAEQNVKANVDFKEGTVAAGSSSDARAAGGQDNSSAAAATSGGMEIYQFTESGISLQATVAGTKYWKDSKLNE
jgi:hypothetical protein